MTFRFPFGETVRRLKQEDRRPKPFFVLGVYSSAVHARWMNQGKIICQALAVASEPYIFWDGNPDEARSILDGIYIPKELGSLALPNSNLNGPSSKVLAENILNPLGITRKDAWLCDLLPESRLNPNQQKVITEKYNPLIEQYGLNKVTVPIEDGKFCDNVRCAEITEEILESQAETLILLGDIPIKQYLSRVCDIDFDNLRTYTNRYRYGNPITLKIGSRTVNVIPIAHPRQIGGLGRSNQFWYDEHKKWESIKVNG